MNEYIPKFFTLEEEVFLYKLHEQSEYLEQEAWKLGENCTTLNGVLECLEKLELINEKIRELDPNSDFNKDKDCEYFKDENDGFTDWLVSQWTVSNG